MIDLVLLPGGKLEKQNIKTHYEVVLFVEKAKEFSNSTVNILKHNTNSFGEGVQSCLT